MIRALVFLLSDSIKNGGITRVLAVLVTRIVDWFSSNFFDIQNAVIKLKRTNFKFNTHRLYNAFHRFETIL